MPAYLAGVDLGTSGAKAIIFDQEGQGPVQRLPRVHLQLPKAQLGRTGSRPLGGRNHGGHWTGCIAKWCST